MKKIELSELKSYLETKIIGQRHAIERLCAAVWRSELGFHELHRPRGSFLFLGSTGVGKTELCLALAETLCGSREKLSRFDMSEYMEKYAVERLIGKVDGFQGQLGQTFRVPGERRVFLFDEMEKAHPDVLNIFLQILDAGRFTAANGTVLDFRDSFIIMTSNVGSSKILTGKLLRSQVERSIKSELFANFRPEFLNRFDEILVFESLNRDMIEKILDLKISEKRKQFFSQGYCLEVNECLRNFIIAEGFDRRLGARPLNRSLVKNLVDPLTSKVILEGLPKGKYRAKMDLVNGKQECVFEPLENILEELSYDRSDAITVKETVSA